MRRQIARARDALRALDGKAGSVKAAQALRRRLPGDRAYGDPLSVAGDEPPQLIGQRLAAMNGRPSAVRELGFGALQLWQAVSEKQGRGPALTARGGLIVKRLGDGLMAVFDDSSDAVDAALEATERVRGIQVDGYAPELRAGIHYGKPRKLGSDYFGVDVNVAARIADAAGPGQVRVSEAVCGHLQDGDVALRRQRRFKAQGTPKGMRVFSCSPDQP